MNIKLSDLVKNKKYLNFQKNYEINLNESSVFLGSNGIGKTSIYNALKKVYKDFDYLDYEDTRENFIKNKNTIIIKINNQELKNIQLEIDDLSKKCSVKEIAKKVGINSQKDVDSLSSVLKEMYGKKIDKLSFSDNDIISLKSIEVHLDFILKNYKALQNIKSIKNDLSHMKEFMLNKILSELSKHIDYNCEVCPVCNTKVLNLKEKLDKKIKELGEIKNEVIAKFINYNSLEVENPTEQFNQILEVIDNIDEKKILEYKLIGCDKDTIDEINENIDKIKKLTDRKMNIQNENESFYDNLIKGKNLYLNYLEENFHAKVDFNDVNKEIAISLERNIEKFSTAEINVILMITMLFSSLGNDNKSIIIDDPISSYDLINQYHIIYHLCRITISKKVIIFTHNPDVINIINSQWKKSYKCFVMDKILSKIIITEISEKMLNQENVLSMKDLINLEKSDKNILIDKHLYLLANRDNGKKGISELLHFDGIEKSYKGDESNLEGCTNTFFIDFIEDISSYGKDAQKDFINICKFKIMALASLRVWLESKMYIKFHEHKKMLKEWRWEAELKLIMNCQTLTLQKNQFY